MSRNAITKQDLKKLDQKVAERFVADNASWLFEHNQDGSVKTESVFDPVICQTIQRRQLSPMGKMFAEKAAKVKPQPLRFVKRLPFPGTMTEADFVYELGLLDIVSRLCSLSDSEIRQFVFENKLWIFVSPSGITAPDQCSIDESDARLTMWGKRLAMYLKAERLPPPPRARKRKKP